MAHGLNISSYLSIVFVFIFFVSGAIIFYYAEAGTPWHTYPTVFACYFSALGILFLVPIDIAMVVIDRTSSTSDSYYTDVNMIRPVYTTFYM